MLKHCQAHLFIQVLRLKMEKRILIITPKFKIDEKSMLVAAEAVGAVVLDYLNSK